MCLEGLLMRFIADAMLGRLSRWLRLLGHDTLSEPTEDTAILRTAIQDGRTLLTRDKILYQYARRVGASAFFIGEPRLENQLVELSKKVGWKRLEIDPSKSRCPVCNGELSELSRSEVSSKVPEKVLDYHSRFWRCNSCGKIYWMGRHWLSIKKKINGANHVLLEGES